MSFRFHKSIKIGGIRVNVGKRGISTTIGPRGASINIGKNGVYANAGIPGTGISYRSKIGGGISNPQRRNQLTSATPSSQDIHEISVKLILDDETGEISWLNENGNPLSEEMIARAKKQNKDIILAMLESKCEEINSERDPLFQVHLETFPPDTLISYTLAEYPENPPIPVDESKYIVPKPQEPKLTKNNFFTRKIGFLRKRLEEVNKQKIDEYQKEVKKTKVQQIELEKKLLQDLLLYCASLTRWHSEKVTFEKEENRKKHLVEVESLTNPDVMMDILWDKWADVEGLLINRYSYSLYPGGEKVWVNFCFPEIETMPKKIAKVNHKKLNLTISELSKSQQRQNYLVYIHAVGIRFLREIFANLPTIQEIIISGYSKQVSRKTGYIEDEYLFSSKVQRYIWEGINFADLDKIDVVSIFERFELRRNISKLGIITPIEPFRNDMVD